MTNGLQFITAYTYGHALANSGTTLSGSNGLYTKDNRNFASSYASASWDIRHNFTTGFTYEIPFGRGKQYGASLNRVVDTLVGNWQVNGILSLRTGNPYTLRANGCQGIFGGCSPDLVNGTDSGCGTLGRPQSQPLVQHCQSDQARSFVGGQPWSADQ